METLLASAQPAELWIADRNFCTRGILAGWQRRGSAFIVREHGRNPSPSKRGALGGVVTFRGGVGYWTQKPYDIPLRGLPVTLLCVGKED